MVKELKRRTGSCARNRGIFREIGQSSQRNRARLTRVPKVGLPVAGKQADLGTYQSVIQFRTLSCQFRITPSSR